MTKRASLTFLGGNGTVTGSKTLLEVDQRRLLVDCGLYQGLRELRRRNWEALPVEAATLSAVLLTHAHLDHTGYLPLLARNGFQGPVHATAPTVELCRIVLTDSAHLQEEDARYAARSGFSKHSAPRPLYDAADVERVLRQLVPVDSTRAVDLDGVGRASWRRAGHILGSASVHLDLDPADTSVLFSGDLGRNGHPLLRPPEPPAPSRYVVVESTYGDRRHQGGARGQLADAIRRAVRRGGSVVIPAFAVDRTEVVLHALAELSRSRTIPDVPVYVDSPMALRALEVYRSAIAGADPDLVPGLRADALDAGNLHEATSPQASQALNVPRSPCIVVSASGMATGGRVLHHLKHLLPDARHAVVLVGYQGAGTRARELADGARQVKIHGRYVPVRAEVVTVDGFSVHADADELLAWLRSAPVAPEACYVVHGEEAAAAGLAGRIRDELDWVAVVPRYGERVRID